jgi:hypothetical protein
LVSRTTFDEFIPLRRLGPYGGFRSSLKAAVSVVSEQVRRPVGASRRLSPSALSIALPVAVAAAVVGWFESVRLRMSTPSLIDDWFGIAYSKPAFHALIHGHYTPGEVDFAGRYRPAYAAIWNYAQWHLFGSPSVTVAAVWGALRVTSFLVAIWLLAVFTGQRPPARRPILWLAPLAVALTPAIAVDLVRHGPADPIMIAGLIIGLTLVGVSVRGFLLQPKAIASRRLWALLFVGYLAYLIGVYSKEASVCLLVFAPFFVKWLSPTWRATIAKSGVSRWLVALTAVLLITPLIHVAVHLAIAKSAGSDPYAGAHFSTARRVLAVLVFPLTGAPGPLGTLLWLTVVPVALVVALSLFRRRDPDRWLVIGVLCTGFLMSAFSLMRGDVPSRYYIPWIVAVAVVALRHLGSAALRVQFAIAILVFGVALPGTQNAVTSWVKAEQSGSTALEMATGVVNAKCSMFLANFDVERRVAIARLLGAGRSRPVSRCVRPTDRTYALSWESARLPGGFLSRCRSGWKEAAVRDGVSLLSCRSFRAGATPDQDEASGRPDVTVVRLVRPVESPRPGSLFQVSSRG